MSKLIDVIVSDGVQVIRFLRADKKNAFTREMYAAMVNALNRADADDETAATVFLGSPGAFSAGNDMADFAARGAGRQIEDAADAMSAARLITTLPLAKKSLIAGVDGLAIGVGVTMLLHCDLVYASPNASFRTPFLNLGLVQEAASSLIGPQRLSYQRAFELLILGETWNADDGYRAGLVNKVVPAADLEETALRAARSLAARPRAALIEARRLMRGDPTPLLEMMKAEGKAFEMLLKSPEAREAFAAFMEKRAPDFAGARRAR